MSRDWTGPREKVDDEGRCRVCGATNGLDPTHLIPRSQVPPGIGEEAGNIVPLCRECHDAQHRHELDLLPYLTREEQATAVFLAGSIAIALRYLAPA